MSFAAMRLRIIRRQEAGDRINRPASVGRRINDAQIPFGAHFLLSIAVERRHIRFDRQLGSYDPIRAFHSLLG